MYPFRRAEWEIACGHCFPASFPSHPAHPRRLQLSFLDGHCLWSATVCLATLRLPIYLTYHSLPFWKVLQERIKKMREITHNKKRRSGGHRAKNNKSATFIQWLQNKVKQLSRKLPVLRGRKCCQSGSVG